MCLKLKSMVSVLCAFISVLIGRYGALRNKTIKAHLSGTCANLDMEFLGVYCIGEVSIN